MILSVLILCSTFLVIHGSNDTGITPLPTDSRLESLEQRVNTCAKIQQSLELYGLWLNETKDYLKTIKDELAPSNSELVIKEHLELLRSSLINQSDNQLAILKEEIRDSRASIRNELSDLLDNSQLTEQLKSVKNQLATTTQDIIVRMQESTYLPTDCKDVRRRGFNTSGIYRIQPKLAPHDFPVWCDMTLEGGGWIYVLNRFDGSQAFYYYWVDYKNGFGNLSGEFWIGLEHLYEITNSQPNELLVELVDWESNKLYARYDDFKIGNETRMYELRNLGNHSGNTSNSFQYHLEQKFTTVDNSSGNVCASNFKGGWWYRNCINVHLTGRYVRYPEAGNNSSGIQWFSDKNQVAYNFKQAKMMIRPRDA